MKRIPLTIFFPKASTLSAGCMGLGGEWDAATSTIEHIQQANALIDASLESGINLFDHADIYTRGKAEAVFGEVLKDRPDLRESIFIQSKCGIRLADQQWAGRYDFSEQWIISSVENSLKRLNTEYLDILLLHRPDPLMEPEEVASAFAKLQSSGKVKHFGVSNMNGHQIKFLRHFVDQPIVVNQMQMSLTHLDWLNDGVTVNHGDSANNTFTAGTVEYCRSHNIQLQAWGSLSKGLFTGLPVDNEPAAIQATAALVAQMATEFGVSKEAIVLAWLLRHSAAIQPVIGTTNPERIRACGQAESIQLSREQWYQLYVTARGHRLP